MLLVASRGPAVARPRSLRGMPTDPAEDAWVEAGLLDPASPLADQRRELLRYLTERGATVDDLRDAADGGRLRGLVAELRRREDRMCTAREIAAESGVDLSRVLQVSRVAGLPIPDPDERAYRPEDVAAVRLFVGAIELFGEQAAVEFTRSVGAALATIADAAMAVFGINVASRYDERGVTEVDRARETTFASQLLTREVPLVLEMLFFHHVDAAARRSWRVAGGSANTVRSAVGFVDLVHSTALVQELKADELARAIGAFEQKAIELIAARDGRVVKTIGDEIMFVVADAKAACDAALALRDVICDDPLLPDVRGAVAVGELVRGYGDYYGVEVNLAARAVKVADPGVIVATSAVRDAADGSFRFPSVGSHALRGFDEAVDLFAVERE